MIKIKAFRADLNPDETARYIEGHAKVLAAYGVTHVTSADTSWKDEPFTYLVIAKSSDTDEVLGGGRIQLAGGTSPLPIETAIDELDNRIYDMVKEKAEKGTGEYCGLWNSRKIAGYGIGSKVLMRIGTAIVDQLTISSLFAFVSPATIRGGLNLGYKIITSLGNNGTFYYPKEDLLATALILNDPLKLKHADIQEQNKIFNLRNNLNQRSIEYGPKGEIEVEYNLKINN